jgi:16S rRNA (cytosine1402-N4)-methyltransferase
MTSEAIQFLNIRPGKIYVDGTLGGAGHAKAICEKILPTGILVGIDQDIDAINNAQRVLKPYEPNIRLFHSNFVHLDRILRELEITAVDGILLDLGLSLHHIESSFRGFGFNREEPLDMRMDVRTPLTAEDLVNEMSEEELIQVFREYGEERHAKSLAGKISAYRKHERIRTSSQLTQIVGGSASYSRQTGKKIHPATKVFMALRIAVNQELKALMGFMDNVPRYLNPGGRLCVLAYHSLEDRIVKNRLKWHEKRCTCPPEFPKCVCSKTSEMRILTRKVVRPDEEEVKGNPMSRSAKLRVAEKI